MSDISSPHWRRFDAGNAWDQEPFPFEHKPAPGKVTLTSRLRPPPGQHIIQAKESAQDDEREPQTAARSHVSPMADVTGSPTNLFSPAPFSPGGVIDEFGGLFEQRAGQSSHDPASTPQSPPSTTLPDVTRRRMERSFGTNFADVQVHPDSPQANGSKHAVTKGRDIHFATGRFQPGTSQGDWLIGHELAHVVQQTGGSAHVQAFDDRAACDVFEAEADRAADAAVTGRSAQVQLRTAFGTPQAFQDSDDRRATVAPLTVPNTEPEASDIVKTDKPDDEIQGQTAKDGGGRDAGNAESKQPDPVASDTQTAETQVEARASDTSVAAPEPQPAVDPGVSQAGDSLEQPSPSNPSKGSNGARDGASGTAAATLKAEISTDNPLAILVSLASVPASQLTSAYAQAQQASPSALEAQREQAQNALLEIPAPTGLPSSKANRSGQGADSMDQKNGRMDSAPHKNRVPQTGKRGNQANEVELVEEVPPAPKPTPTRLAGRDAPANGSAQGEGEKSKDPALARSATSALGRVNMPTGQIPTKAKDTPRVDVAGDADPGQLQSSHADSLQQTREASTVAVQTSGQDFGENDIFPTSNATMLAPTTALGTVQAPEVGDIPSVVLPPEAQASIDAEVTPVLSERIGEQQSQYDQAKSQYDADSQSAHEQANREIGDLEQGARAEQMQAQMSAQADVSTARQDWQSEIDGVGVEFREKADAARVEQRAKIQLEEQAGNRQAADHIAQAERQAADKKSNAEAEAASKKQAANKESKGFWGWIKSKAKTFIDGLKSAISVIFEGLRKAVQALFEAAKKLALAAIEAARHAIIGLIQAYGELLKGFVSIALAAFPELRQRFIARIDQAVAKATEAVDAVADALKTAVTAVLDFLASTIDQLLGLFQNLFNGLLTVIGMLISGEFAELLKKVDNLIAAAKTAPGQFETAAYEELLGGDLDQPLSPQELIAAGRTPPTSVGVGSDAANGDMASLQNDISPSDESFPYPPWTQENVGVEPVVDGMELSPELASEIQQRVGGSDGAFEFGHSEDASRSMSAILGTQGQQHDQISEHTGETLNKQETVPDDGLSPRERAEVKWTVMKQGLSQWWANNWPLVLSGGVLAVAGFVVANILSGGVILAALLKLMPVIGALFTGVTIAHIAGHVRDFLSKGWEGDIPGGGKSLAKGLAAGAVELIMLLTMKAGSAALKGAKATAKNVVQGAKSFAYGAVRATKGATRLAKRGAQWAIKGGKVLFRGIGRGLGKAARAVREFGARLLARTKFKGFRVRIRNRRFKLEGKINPWVTIAEGDIVHAEPGTHNAFEVDDVAKFTDDYNFLRKLRRAEGETMEAWKKRIDDLADNLPDNLTDSQLDLLDQSMSRIKKQGQINSADELGAKNWVERKKYWKAQKFKNGQTIDDNFWNQIENASNSQQVQAAQKQLDDLMQEIKTTKRADKDGLLKDLTERQSKLTHRQKKLDAAGANKKPPTDAELLDQIVNTKHGDVFAASKQQAQNVQDLLQTRLQFAKRRGTGNYDPSDFHGPERHGGTRTNVNSNPNEAPDDWHLNVKGELDGKTFKVHIYYPE